LTKEALKFNALTKLGRERTSLDLFWLDSSVTRIAKKFSTLATDFKVLTTRCSEISPTRYSIVGKSNWKHSRLPEKKWNPHRCQHMSELFIRGKLWPVGQELTPA